jgi:hypothetical protein
MRGQGESYSDVIVLHMCARLRQPNSELALRRHPWLVAVDPTTKVISITPMRVGGPNGDNENRVLCVKFCKRQSCGLVLCGLAEVGFLVLLEIVHVEVTVGLEPVLVSFDGERADETATGG